MDKISTKEQGKEEVEQGDPTTCQLMRILGLTGKPQDLLTEFDGVPLRRGQASNKIQNAIE